MRKNNSGFTLVELIVSIAVATIVFAAASSFMLFGMRMEKAASENAAAQNESGILLRTLESIAAEGRIGDVVYNPNYNHDTNSEGQIKWLLYEEEITEENQDDPPYLLGFDEGRGVIFGKGGMSLLEDLVSADISFENNVLSCTIETEKGETYKSSVYVRVGVEGITLAEIKVEPDGDNYNVKVEDEIDISLNNLVTNEEAAARKALLATMLSQYGSTGKIDDPASLYDGLYYSQWYKLEWGRDTPWCSIFVSWCIETMLEKAAGGNKDFPWMGALVDTVMWYQLGREPGSPAAVDMENNYKHVVSMGSETVTKYTDEYEELKEDYKNAVIGTWQYPTSDFIPNPGDLVFFENDDTNDRADHVGVVLYVENGTVYTIEGNHNNRVGIFSYPMIKEKDATEYIIGYGILDWVATGLVPAQE